MFCHRQPLCVKMIPLELNHEPPDCCGRPFTFFSRLVYPIQHWVEAPQCWGPKVLRRMLVECYRSIHSICLDMFCFISKCTFFPGRLFSFGAIQPRSLSVLRPTLKPKRTRCQKCSKATGIHTLIYCTY